MVEEEKFRKRLEDLTTLANTTMTHIRRCEMQQALGRLQEYEELFTLSADDLSTATREAKVSKDVSNELFKKLRSIDFDVRDTIQGTKCKCERA